MATTDSCTRAIIASGISLKIDTIAVLVMTMISAFNATVTMATTIQWTESNLVISWVAVMMAVQVSILFHFFSFVD